jgi:hypothetical protein
MEFWTFVQGIEALDLSKAGTIRQPVAFVHEISLFLNSIGTLHKSTHIIFRIPCKAFGRINSLSTKASFYSLTD